MTKKTELGLFWDHNSFYFTETSGNNVVNTFNAPFKLSGEFSNTNNETTDGILLSDILQNTLKSNQITSTSINLSLPTKDIIFRSFVIPSMQSSEIKSAVEFESGKYIPFELQDLAYTYHPMPVSDKRKKQLLIVFVAIRKGVLNNYINLLEHTGLHINNIEPAPLSLVRALTLRKQFQKNKTTAVIETDDFSGRIIIVQNSIPLFVREFQLTLPTEKAQFDADTLQARLFNESRISLDYYARQNPDTKIDKIIVLSADKKTDTAENLGNYLNIPASNILANEILKPSRQGTIGNINAFGGSLRDSYPIDANFDLSLKSSEELEAAALKAQKPNYINVVITALFWGFMLFLAFNFNNKKVKVYSAELQQIKSEIGIYESQNLQDITEESKKVSKKLEAYESIRQTGKIADYLTLIPQMLPDGVWINNLSLTYFDRMEQGAENSELQIMIDGYAYTDDRNQQLKLVNKFLNNLNNTDHFSKQFQKINLTSATRQTLEGYSVILFKIDCN